MQGAPRASIPAPGDGAAILWRLAALIGALAMALLAVGLVAADVDAGKKKKCKKGLRCESSVNGAVTASGGGFQISLPWPSGHGAFYDDPNDTSPGGKGLVMGGRCGYYEGQGSHRDQGDAYADDRFAIDFGLCGKSDKDIPVLAAHSGRVIESKSDGEYGADRGREERGGRHRHALRPPRLDPERDQEEPGSEQERTDRDDRLERRHQGPTPALRRLLRRRQARAGDRPDRRLRARGRPLRRVAGDHGGSVETNLRASPREPDPCQRDRGRSTRASPSRWASTSASRSRSTGSLRRDTSCVRATLVSRRRSSATRAMCRVKRRTIRRSVSSGRRWWCRPVYRRVTTC